MISIFTSAIGHPWLGLIPMPVRTLGGASLALGGIFPIMARAVPMTVCRSLSIIILVV